MSEVKNLELYIHIPFCVKKCNYCDFLSFAASDEDKDRYIAALSEEILKAGEIYQDHFHWWGHAVHSDARTVQKDLRSASVCV